MASILFRPQCANHIIYALHKCVLNVTSMFNSVITHGHSPGDLITFRLLDTMISSSDSALQYIACRSATNTTSSLGKNKVLLYIYHNLSGDPALDRHDAEANGRIDQLHELLRILDRLVTYVNLLRVCGHGCATATFGFLLYCPFSLNPHILWLSPISILCHCYM